MNVWGVNTDTCSHYVCIYFREHLATWTADARRSRCQCSQVEGWLEHVHGITQDDYIIRDVFTQPKSRQEHISNFSYAVLDMHNDEHIVALKTFYPEYRKGF